MTCIGTNLPSKLVDVQVTSHLQPSKSPRCLEPNSRESSGCRSSASASECSVENLLVCPDRSCFDSALSLKCLFKQPDQQSLSLLRAPEVLFLFHGVFI